MKRIVSCFLSSVLMFSFIGCFGKNFDVNSDVFNIKKAGEIASNYMENVTRGNFDEKVGITTSHYGMIELGVRNPSLITARKLAVFFNTTIENIFF